MSMSIQAGCPSRHPNNSIKALKDKALEYNSRHYKFTHNGTNTTTVIMDIVNF